MIEEHLEQLRTKLEQAAGLPDSARAELLQLVQAVKADAGLGGATETSEATEGDGGGINKLLSAVDELEASHPELAASINQVANTLAKMGI